MIYKRLKVNQIECLSLSLTIKLAEAHEVSSLEQQRLNGVAELARREQQQLALRAVHKPVDSGAEAFESLQ